MSKLSDTILAAHQASDVGCSCENWDHSKTSFTTHVLENLEFNVRMQVLQPILDVLGVVIKAGQEDDTPVPEEDDVIESAPELAQPDEPKFLGAVVMVDSKKGYNELHTYVGGGRWVSLDGVTSHWVDLIDDGHITVESLGVEL